MATLQEFKRIMQTALDKTPKEPINKSGAGEVRAAHISRWIAGKGITGPLKFKPTRKTPSNGAYSKAYVPIKKKAGRQTSHVDLLLKGEFHRSTTVDGNEIGMRVNNNDDDGKLKGLDNYYNEDEIYGIREDQIPQIGMSMQPTIMKEIQKTILNAL